jgi:hypothetical protein
MIRFQFHLAVQKVSSLNFIYLIISSLTPRNLPYHFSHISSTYVSIGRLLSFLLHYLGLYFVLLCQMCTRENSSLTYPQASQGLYFKKFFRRHLNPLGISVQTPFEISSPIGIILPSFCS